MQIFGKRRLTFVISFTVCKASPIVVKFTNYDSKHEIYSRHLRLRKLNLME